MMFNVLKLIRTSSRDTSQDQERLNRQQRMAEKLAQIKSDMGEKWILHPCHKVAKLDKPRGF